jgi:hypothetical protein
MPNRFPRGKLCVLDWQAEIWVFPPELHASYLMDRGEQEPRRTTPRTGKVLAESTSFMT